MIPNRLRYSLSRNTARASLLGLSLAMLSLPAAAAPYSGQSFDLQQPDGSRVPVVVYGDEFYQHVESPQGYTLTRDSAGWICYAQLNATGTDLVSTGVRYGVSKASARGAGMAALPLQQHIKLPPQAIRAKVKQAKDELNTIDEFSGGASPTKSAAAATAPAAPAARVGAVRGLTLLIDFPDEPGTVPQSDVVDYCNLPGYNQNGNNGSIRDYYYEVSGGQLEYTNTVTAYYTAVHPKSYYDSAAVQYGSSARELITEALTDLEDNGFDFSTLSTDSSGRLLILNALYAGSPDQGWAKGLWPHASGLGGSFSADGVTVDAYQITNIGAALYVGTFIHENGHALCGWPDLYDYGYESTGAGNFDVMAYGGSSLNPVPPNAYFRELCGWETPVDISNRPTGTVLSQALNSNTSFRWSNPSTPNEFFIIESRKQVGRNAALPDEGLLIWHVDTNGSNDYQDMTASSHYLVSVEQADGQYHLENNMNYGDGNDLYDGVTSTSFSITTVPDSNWWSGYESGLSISNISPLTANSTTMSFTLNGTEVTKTLNLSMLLAADNSPNDNSIHTMFDMKNQETTPLDLSKYDIAYYLYEPNLTVSDATWNTYYCNRSGNVVGALSQLASPNTSGTYKADKQLVFSFPAGTMLPAGATLHLEGSLHSLNWQYFFSESDDWSHAVNGKTEYIAVIDKATGKVVFGKSPVSN